ncbi:rod shape-determining protein MreD [Polaribacter pacificus]|uniref:Rod shape-determining protein MreD n=1 Tax=Polaribacter pacificus TaxID=1775173 RepID=A0A917HWB5_9FLAO|nr:rod shape-determining protein MreD [Polaribacter pacificus]GGG90690.1 rod shape-determining protein MreD [Polaribacter pacificus]
MNKRLYVVFMFFTLLFLQVFVLNNILFLGYINPYLYVAFVIFYPLKEERFSLLLFSFLLGLSVDFFTDSGGIHAFSLLFVAYIRLTLIKLVFKKSSLDYLLFDLNKEPYGKVFNFVMIIIITHHFLLFFLANFSFNNLTSVLTQTVYSSIFTAILFFLGNSLFRNKK